MSALADGETPQNERKGGRFVKSRYLQYAEKDFSKNASAKSFSSSASSASSTAKARSVLSQKSEASAGVASGSLSQSSFERSDLQSTLLDGDKITRPDLDLSVINDKAVRWKTTSSKASCKADKGTCVEKQKSKNNPSVLGEELRSQELILTYLRVKQEKDLAELEEKAEQNLLMLCEEKERQQEKLYELKREILLKEREEKLEEELVKQMEVLSPLLPLLERFKEQYKSFAVALDATRHKLPIKNIHIEGDMPTYLDELQKQLAVTRELLAEVVPGSSEESAKAFSELQDTEEVFQKLEKELQRYLTTITGKHSACGFREKRTVLTLCIQNGYWRINCENSCAKFNSLCSTHLYFCPYPSYEGKFFSFVCVILVNYFSVLLPDTISQNFSEL